MNLATRGIGGGEFKSNLPTFGIGGGLFIIPPLKICVRIRVPEVAVAVRAPGIALALRAPTVVLLERVEAVTGSVDLAGGVATMASPKQVTAGQLGASVVVSERSPDVSVTVKRHLAVTQATAGVAITERTGAISTIIKVEDPDVCD